MGNYESKLNEPLTDSRGPSESFALIPEKIKPKRKPPLRPDEKSSKVKIKS